jgi:hypothetical protein
VTRVRSGLHCGVIRGAEPCHVDAWVGNSPHNATSNTHYPAQKQIIPQASKERHLLLGSNAVALLNCSSRLRWGPALLQMLHIR